MVGSVCTYSNDVQGGGVIMILHSVIWGFFPKKMNPCRRARLNGQQEKWGKHNCILAEILHPLSPHRNKLYILHKIGQSTFFFKLVNLDKKSAEFYTDSKSEENN